MRLEAEVCSGPSQFLYFHNSSLSVFPVATSCCVLDIVLREHRVVVTLLFSDMGESLGTDLSGRHSLSSQICIFQHCPARFGAPALPSSTSTLQSVLSRDPWIKFVKLLELAQEKYSSLLPAEPQPHWLGFVCLRPTIVFRLILTERRAQSQWEWCISSSASIKAACCGWSQTRLWRDLSSRLPKRGDWIHLLTNEEGLRMVHFPSHTSTC